MEKEKCKGCKPTEKTSINVPYVVHESTVARMERIIKRQWIALIVAICMIVGCNALWLYAWMQYDYTSEETIYQQDGQGTNIIGDRNEVEKGTESDNTKKDTP